MQAHQDALNVIALETRTAESVMGKEEARQAHGKRMTRSELKELVPSFHWDDFFHGIEMPDVGLVRRSPYLPTSPWTCLFYLSCFLLLACASMKMFQMFSQWLALTNLLPRHLRTWTRVRVHGLHIHDVDATHRPRK
jgi:hypothetical protein